jgi:hypothetical protein
MNRADVKLDNQQKPRMRCHLGSPGTGSVLKRVVFEKGGKQTNWDCESSKGERQKKAFCIGLLLAKFRSAYDLSNPNWAELSKAKGNTWAKTLSENLCRSKRKHVGWWNKGLENVCPGSAFPFRMLERPPGKVFRVHYMPSEMDDESCWAVDRLQIFDGEDHLIGGLRLLAIARQLENSEKDWEPILPSDEEVKTWAFTGRQKQAEENGEQVGLSHKLARDNVDGLKLYPSPSGREWLLKLVDQFIAERTSESRYLILVAEDGYGKSTIAAEIIRRTPGVAAYHFIKRGQDTDTILLSVVAQLQLRYHLPVMQSNGERNSEALFRDTLVEVSASLPPGEQTVVIVDGLDHTVEPSNLCSVAFPVPPPARCKVILTSASGDHLRLLEDTRFCKKLLLESFSGENYKDMHEWMSSKECLGLFTEQGIDSWAMSLKDSFASALWWKRKLLKRAVFLP